jgi:hypothetical protein
MVLVVNSKITMDSVDCEKCNVKINIWEYSHVIKCSECGAVYNIQDKIVNDNHIEYRYVFDYFKCINSYIYEDCENKCPAPYMFCKEHCNDKSIKSLKDHLAFCEEQLRRAEKRLELVKESKKTWLIQELSGIHED